MTIPKFLQPYLASYDVSKLRADAPAVREEIITQVLNTGDTRAVRWVFKTYPLKTIKETLCRPKPGMWFKTSLSYWLKIFNLKLPPKVFMQGILNLDPYASSWRFK